MPLEPVRDSNGNPLKKIGMNSPGQRQRPIKFIIRTFKALAGQSAADYKKANKDCPLLLAIVKHY